MQRLKLLVLSVLIFSLMAACSTSPIKPSSHSDSSGEEIADTVAKKLFESAVKEIITLASEDPTYIIKMILEDVEIIDEEKQIKGVSYYKTTAAYKEVHDYYSEVFTGDALNWILSTKFADVDGTLYCSSVGGASGWSIANLEVKRTGQNSDTYMYEATFKEFENTTTSQFMMEKTEGGYRISSINYIPDLLRAE